MGFSQSKDSHFSLIKEADRALNDIDATVDVLEKAVLDCQAAINLCPTYPYGYLVLAKLFMRLGQPKEAAAAAENAVEAKPDMYVGYALLADCLESADEYEAAMQARSHIPKPMREDVMHAYTQRHKVYLLPPRSTNPGPSGEDVELRVGRHPLMVPNGCGEMVSVHKSAGLSDSEAPSLDPSRQDAEPETSQPTSPTAVYANPQQPMSADDVAIAEWYRKRTAEHRDAMKRDWNSKRFRLGQRGVYVRSATQKQVLKDIGEHREKFTKLSHLSL